MYPHLRGCGGGHVQYRSETGTIAYQGGAVSSATHHLSGSEQGGQSMDSASDIIRRIFGDQIDTLGGEIAEATTRYDALHMVEFPKPE